MSHPPSVGTTLTGGIQDIAALLPLLGTDQCEKHVGSALEGGYLYAAATPLSIFGSLGIVKIGLSVLMSSISIPKPSFSFKFTPYPKLSVTFHGRRWLGARILDHAGFKPVGTVAPLIAMNGTRYTAETRLMEILKEKHIEDPERLTVEWKSAEWNVMLVLCIMVAALCSTIPYIALISPRFRPSVVHSPWTFPLLRTVGGSLAAVCCQFLIQSRVISLMKNRVIFMIMNRILLDDLKSKSNNPDLDIRNQNAFRWGENIPSEECLWNLKQYLRSQCSNTQRSNPNEGGNLPISPSIEHSATGQRQDHPRDVTIQMDTFEFFEPPPEDSSTSTRESSIPSPDLNGSQSDVPVVSSIELQDQSHVSIPFGFAKPEDILDKLHNVRNEHIQTSSFNSAFIVISWVILSLSLPATVAGYIGCFTLVSGSRGNGPLIWLLLEAGLLIIRILLWAWNPSFDERTDITVRLNLTGHQPLVTTEKDIEVIEQTGENTLSLVPERQFLKWITSYTGPLEHFQTSENLALYFTLTGKQAEKHLYLTVFDINKRNAVTLQKEAAAELEYIDTLVTYNKVASEMQATLQSAIGKDHPWRRNHAMLFDTLSEYYSSIIDALNRSHLRSIPPANSQSNLLYMMFRMPMHLFRLPPNTQNEPRSAKAALIPRKWSLLPKYTGSHEGPATIREPLPLTEHDEIYLQRGYEHHLKTKLVEKWSIWIVESIDTGLRTDAWDDCYHALTDQTSEEAKWEFTELDMQLAFEWMRREWLLVVSSCELEGILLRRKEECIDQIVKERENGPLGDWMRSEFGVGQQKRLEKEREQAKERMKKEMKISAERAEAEGRAWSDQGTFSPKRMWEAGQEFIDEQWRAAIESREMVLPADLDQLFEENTPRSAEWETEERKARRIFVEQVRVRFEHWQHLRRNEKNEMDAVIERIRNADTDHLDAYQYPEWHWQVAHKFVKLDSEYSVAKFLSATVYDLQDCNEGVNDVIQKETTRSVINVHSDLVDSIPENDHLLYLSSPDGHEPPFIKRNRDRWWDQQTSNSSMSYFSPQWVFSRYVCSESHTIAHIFIFLQTRTCIRLRLLHCRDNQAFLSIRENDNEVRFLSTDDISERLRLQDFDLNWFEPGGHELQMVVTKKSDRYYLRDILVEFFDPPSEDF